MRSSLLELVNVKLCNIDTVTRYQGVHEAFICIPVPLDHIEFYQEVVRSTVVRAAFLELDLDYTGERLDRAIEFICSSNKLYYASMPPRNYGLTSNGYLYLNPTFSDIHYDDNNILRLITLLHETAHVIIRINEPVENWRCTSSPSRSIAHEKDTDSMGTCSKNIQESTKICVYVRDYLYVSCGFMKFRT